MKINGASVNKVVNLYSNNTKISEKSPVKTSKDTIQISTVGKSLSSLTVDGNFGHSTEQVESLRKQVAQGTYKPDCTLTAKKMIDNIKGRGV